MRAGQDHARAALEDGVDDTHRSLHDRGRGDFQFVLHRLRWVVAG